MPWALASVPQGIEFRIAERLRDRAGFEVYVPIWRKSIKPRHGRRRELVLPLFARFAFIRSCPATVGQDRARIAGTTSQCRLMRARDYEYIWLRDWEVADLRAREAAHEFDQLDHLGRRPIEIKVGTIVFVVGTAFEGHRAIVEARLGRDRYQVGINGFTVSLGVDQLRRGEDGNEP